MFRRLLINEKPFFASVRYSHQQLSRVPLGTANRHSQFHCPKSKISKVWFALEEEKQKGLGPYLNLVLYILLLNNLFYLGKMRDTVWTRIDPAERRRRGSTQKFVSFQVSGAPCAKRSMHAQLYIRLRSR